MSEIINGHCPNCNNTRKSEIVANYKVESQDEDHPIIWGETVYRILKCLGCEAIYFQKMSRFSEDTEYRKNPQTGEYEEYLVPSISYWPAPSKRDEPEWIDVLSVDQMLYGLIKEVYTALNNDLQVIAAIGIRTVFDKGTEILKIDAALPFNEKLEKLIDLKYIGEREKEILNVLTDAGSAAAHRGWKPTASELSTMMEIIENFFYRTFVLEELAKKLKPKIPPKPKRKKGQGSRGI